MLFVNVSDSFLSLKFLFYRPLVQHCPSLRHLNLLFCPMLPYGWSRDYGRHELPSFIQWLIGREPTTATCDSMDWHPGLSVNPSVFNLATQRLMLVFCLFAQAIRGDLYWCFIGQVISDLQYLSLVIRAYICEMNTWWLYDAIKATGSRY